MHDHDARTGLAALLILAALITQPVAAQEASCSPTLNELIYPPSALQDSPQVEGLVRMTTTIDSNGKATEFDSSAYPSLRASVEEALRAEHFDSGCSGNRITIQVNFRIDQGIDSHAPISVKRISETSYEVIAPSRLLETSNVDPAWIFTRKGRALHRVNGWLSKLKFW